jgi:hypothetical protein
MMSGVAPCPILSLCFAHCLMDCRVKPGNDDREAHMLFLPLTGFREGRGSIQ